MVEQGRFGAVREYSRAGAARGVVFLFSSDSGWDGEAERAARLIADFGVVVVGVDLVQYLRGLAASDDGCHYLISEVEELSKQIQHEHGFTDYCTPVLAGMGAGGTLAYAALAQSPAATVAGAAAVDPAPSLRTKVPLCPGAKSLPDPAGGYRYQPGATLPGWWRVDEGEKGEPAERLTALLRAASWASDTPAERSVQDLPLIEYPVPQPGRQLVVIYSGDGGWRDLDKQIGETLAREGTPVVGVDSLRYFWRRKSPETMAQDLAMIVRTYGTRWGATDVALVGYSFGADILPFAFNRLPDDVRERVRQLSLLGLESTAAFEFSVAGWLGADKGDEMPVLPELLKIDSSLVQCFYGEEEDDSLCRTPELRAAEIVRTTGGHHFDGDYRALARRILEGLRRRAAIS